MFFYLVFFRNNAQEWVNMENVAIVCPLVTYSVTFKAGKKINKNAIMKAEGNSRN